ncbi:MAG TPA: hypothetical protein VFL97_02230 [Nitrococcus sp.]|nr:hypothetical protein [Nitrococcus sp.]
MKPLLLAALLTAAAVPAFAQVGVSVSVGEPGFYGQIHIGGMQPLLVYPRPVVIAPAPRFIGAPPIYLRVPPGYATHWRMHCAEYRACGRPVYFVRNDWYRDRYVPYYQARYGHHYDEGNHHHREHGHHGDHGHGQQDRRGDYHDH